MKKIIFVMIIIFTVKNIYSFSRIEIQTSTVSLNSNFVKEFGNLISFNQTSPAESLGITGFDLRGNFKIANINSDQPYWINSVSGGTSDKVYIQHIVISKGLPLGIDIEAAYMPIKQSKITAAGGALKWSFIKGNTVKPAFALRAAYSTLIDKTNFKAEDISISLSVSKGFGPVTPYGIVSSNITKISDVKINSISNKTVNNFKYGIGFKASIVFLKLNGSVLFGDKKIYNFSVNIGF